jgi:prepilin-type N-terminal cleavage/methylation domain-containing protein
MTRTASRPRRRAGFTLIEVMVALTVAGLVVLMAQRIFGATADGVAAVRESRARLDREANAHRWLASAFLSLEVGLEGSAPFEGSPRGMTFTSRLAAEHGWAERSKVSLGIEDARFIALTGNGSRLVLSSGAAEVAFDYLLEPGADARWVGTWSSPASAPLAVRVRVSRAGTVDTALFLIRGRG